MDTRELNVIIKGDASDFKRAMGDVEEKSGGIKGAFDKAAGGSFALLGGLTALGVGAAAFGVQAVKAFNEAAAANAQLDAVLQSTGQAIGWTKDNALALSGSMQKLNAIDDDAVTSMQAMLLTFTNIGKDIFPDVSQATLDMATAMNGGLTPSAEELRQQAIQLGKALQDPDAGLGALHRVGVNVDELKKKFTDGMPIQEKQKLILKELATEFGGSGAAAAKTFGGQLNMLQVNFGNLMEAIGGGITTFLGPLVTAFNNWFDSMGGPEGVMGMLTEKAQQLQPWLPVIAGALVGGLIPAFVALGSAIWTALAPLLPFIAIGAAIGLAIKLIVDHLGGWDATMKKLQPVMDWFKGAWEKIVEVWNTYLLPALQMLWNEFQTKLLPALQAFWQEHGQQVIQVLQILAIIIGVVLLVAIGIIIASIYILINVFTFIVNAVNWVISELQRQWQQGVDSWNATVAFIKAGIDAFVAFFQNLPQNIGFIIGSIIRWFMELPGNVANMVNAVINWLSQLPGRANAFMANLINTVANWLNQLPGRAQSAAQGLVNGFINFMQGLPGMVGGIFNNVINTVAGWAGSMFNKARDIAGKFWEGFKQGLGIHSPSYIEKAFMAIGTQSQDTLAQMSTDMDKLNNISFGNFNTLLGTQSGAGTTNNNNAQNNKIDVTIMGNAGAPEVQDGLLNGLRVAARGI